MDRREQLQMLFPGLVSDLTTGKQESGYSFMNSGFYIENNIDLTGWAMDDYTFYTLDTQLQCPGKFTLAGTNAVIEEMYIVCTQPLSKTEIDAISDTMGATAPGLLYSGQNREQVIYGRYNLYCANSTLGIANYLQLVESHGFGSKEPTAADRLFCYRLIKVGGTSLGQLITPASILGLFGLFAKEPELNYMMRLKRSYELNQQS